MANEESATQQPLTRHDIEAKIVTLAWQDDEFRKKFLADPKAQFEEKLGAKLPDNLKITAHQEDESHLHFVIPNRRPMLANCRTRIWRRSRAASSSTPMG